MLLRKLTDTEIPDHFSRGLFEEKGIDIAPEHMTKILDSAVTGIANLLNNAKSTDKPTAYTITRFDHQFVVACIVEYFDNTDKNNPGNWSMVWTFDEADIPKDALKIDISNVETHSYIRSIAGEKYGMKYYDESCLVTTTIYGFSQIKKWLDENASESEEIGVEVESLFQARVIVENGVKIFAIEADGEIKNLIKDDAAIEK